MNIENQKEYMEKIKKINEGKNLKYSIFTMGCQLNEMIQKNYVEC